MADFGLYYHNFKYGHGNAKKVSVAWLHFKAELSFSHVNMEIHGLHLSFQGCVPVKWTAPEVLYGNIANLSSKSDVYVLSEIKSQFYCFSSESIIFARVTTRKSIWFLTSRVTCIM